MWWSPGRHGAVHSPKQPFQKRALDPAQNQGGRAPCPGPDMGAQSPEAYEEWASSNQEFRLPRSCYAESYSQWQANPGRPSNAF